MNEENIKSDDYISIPGFKKIILLILHSFFTVFHQIVDVIKNSKLLLAAGLVTGLVVGYSYYTTRPVFYEVTMIAESTQLPKRTVGEVVNQLDQLIKTGSHSKLASELNLSDKEARQLSSIEASTFDNESMQSDTSSKMHQPFKIVATIRQNDLADKIQLGVANYLNNKPSIKRLKEDKIRITNIKLALIDRDIAKLDTLKTEYNKFLASGKISTTFYSNAFDPGNIYEQSIAILDEKEKLMTWLSTDSLPILVIDEFKPISAPQSASLFKSLLWGTVIAVGICFLLGLFIELDRKIRKYT
jgi:hypothetical protein